MACLWQIHVMSAFSDILPFFNNEDWSLIFKKKLEQIISNRIGASWWYGLLKVLQHLSWCSLG